MLSLRIRLFETNFLGPQGCLNKKHTCGEPTAGVVLEELDTMIKHYNLICMKKLGNK